MPRGWAETAHHCLLMTPPRAEHPSGKPQPAINPGDATGRPESPGQGDEGSGPWSGVESLGTLLGSASQLRIVAGGRDGGEVQGYSLPLPRGSPLAPRSIQAWGPGPGGPCDPRPQPQPCSLSQLPASFPPSLIKSLRQPLRNVKAAVAFPGGDQWGDALALSLPPPP